MIEAIRGRRGFGLAPLQLGEADLVIMPLVSVGATALASGDLLSTHDLDAVGSGYVFGSHVSVALGDGMQRRWSSHGIRGACCEWRIRSRNAAR